MNHKSGFDCPDYTLTPSPRLQTAARQICRAKLSSVRIHAAISSVFAHQQTSPVKRNARRCRVPVPHADCERANAVRAERKRTHGTKIHISITPQSPRDCLMFAAHTVISLNLHRLMFFVVRSNLILKLLTVLLLKCLNKFSRQLHARSLV